MRVTGSLGIVAMALLLAISFGERGAAGTSPVLQLSIDGRSNTASSVASRGNVVAVAWNAAPASGGSDVFVAVSRDGGASFGSPVRVNDVAAEVRSGGEFPPRVALGPAEPGGQAAIVVVWRSKREQTNIRLARSTDGGRTFAAATTVEAAGAAGERGWHSVAVGPDGRIHTIWLDHRGLAPPPGAAPHVHGAHKGSMDGVAMAQRSALYYASAEATTAPERELTRGVCYCCKTAVAASPRGRVYAAWRHVYAGNIRDIGFIASRDGGRTFGEPRRVSEDGWQIAGCPDDGPSMVAGSDERVHVVWPTVIGGAEPRGALFYASTTDGESFSERLRIPTFGGPKPTHPQIVTADHRLVVAWDEVIDGERKAGLTVMNPGAGGTRPAFEPAVMLDPSGPSSTYPMLAAVPGGVVATWTSGTGESAVIAVRRLPLRPVGESAGR